MACYSFLLAKEKDVDIDYGILISFALLGMIVMVNSLDLIVIFLALEIQAFVFYTIIGLKKGSLFAAEAALKYFLIGSCFSLVCFR